jgi:hypothetical protein
MFVKPIIHLAFTAILMIPKKNSISKLVAYLFCIKYLIRYGAKC